MAWVAFISSQTPFVPPCSSRRGPTKNSYSSFVLSPFPFPPRKPVNEISYHRPYTALINHYKFLIENSTPFIDAKHTTKISLALSDCMVRACMDMVQSTSAPNKPSPSPFKALAGVLWVHISKVRGLRNGLWTCPSVWIQDLYFRSCMCV